MIRWDDARRAVDLSVHDLLAAGAGVGEATMSWRARLALGARLHRALQADSALAAEVTLRRTRVHRGWTCTVGGRVDGLGEEDDRLVVEELKSTLLPGERLAGVASFPAWARQLALYLYLADTPRALGRLRVVSLVDGAERFWTMAPDPALEAEVDATLDTMVRRREAWLAWRARRRDAGVAFAFPVRRAGQEEIAAAVEDAAWRGRHHLVTAPTGVGKTAAVLHGALRGAIATDRRVYWATTKTSQQWGIERTLRAVVAAGTPLRAVTLVAQERACPGCVPAACARFAAAPDPDPVAEAGVVGPDELARLAAAQGACPWRLGRVAAEQVADVVVGDLNLALDPDLHLRALTGADTLLVVDEAHQLPDRAMAWGSPGIESARALAAARAWAHEPSLARLAREVADAIDDAVACADDVVVEPSRPRWRDLADRVDELALDHAALPPPPEDPWPVFARSVLRFAAALERAGDETVGLVEPGRLRLYCRDPAPVLAPRFAALGASALVSATLHPTAWYRARCGLDEARTDALSVASPFPPGHRLVVIGRGVSTTWRDRARERPKLVDALERTIAAVPGNTAVFFGSFEQAHDLTSALSLPGRELRVQTRGMDEAARRALVADLDRPGPPQVLVAVLGGVFGEGVDLPDGRLDAVIVVGPGFPPPGVERRLLEAWLEERAEDAGLYSWVHPGMTRVVQAAGRVVRGPEERGAVVLLCRRFQRDALRAYLPADWEVRISSAPWAETQRFFTARDSST